MQINNISTLVELVLFVLQVSYICFHVIKTNNIRLITVSYSDAIGAFFKFKVSSLKGLCAVFDSMDLIVPTHGPVSYYLWLNRRRTNPIWYCLPSWNYQQILFHPSNLYYQGKNMITQFQTKLKMYSFIKSFTRFFS